MVEKRPRTRQPAPPASAHLPLINAGEDVAHWLDHYWRKLRLPPDQANYLAVTDSRQEFAVWTGRRLNSMALGCYCYLPIYPAEGADAAEIGCAEPTSSTMTAPVLTVERPTLSAPTLWGFIEETRDFTDDALVPVAPLAATYRHLIFIEPGLLPASIEVTVAHELIHLSDRIQGNPRKHRCHGHDAISIDEAQVTGRDPEALRMQLREEADRREAALRTERPYRYIYSCSNCLREYPRVKKYSRVTSCGHCDSRFNPMFELQVRALAKGEAYRGESPSQAAITTDEPLAE